MRQFAESFTCGRGTEEQQRVRRKRIQGMATNTDYSDARMVVETRSNTFKQAFCPVHGPGGATRCRSRWGMNCCGAEPVEEG